MRIAISGKLRFLLPLGVVALALGLRFVPGIMERAQLLSFDAFQHLLPREAAASPVRIVAIDDASLARYGQWPWPRTLVAELIGKLQEAGAASIGLDIVFAEPDRLSPKALANALAQRIPRGEEVARLADDIPDNDAVLAQTIRKGSVVIGHALTPDPGTQLPAAKAGYSWSGTDPTVKLMPYGGAVANLAVLEAASAGNGFFNHAPEWDRVVRRVPLLARVPQDGAPPRIFASLAAESLRVAEGARSYLGKGAGASNEESFGENSGMVALRVGRVQVPTDPQGRVWLHYTSESPGTEEIRAARYVSAKDVLEGTADPARLNGNIVLVGATFAASQDFVATPVHPQMAGIEVHAELLEQILDEDFLRRPDWAWGAETVFMGAVAAGLVFLIPAVGAVLGAGAAGVGIAAALGGSWYAFAGHRLLIDPVYPAAVILLVYGIASLVGYMRTEARQRQIRNAFMHYMSPHLVDELAEHPEKLVLGGEVRTMTLLFADIRGFTTISEGLSAQELTHLINDFLTPMTDIIMANKGYIDKYIGDCIMAFWNAPIDDPGHAQNAIRAAQQMRRTLAEMNRRREAEAKAGGKRFIPIRIGIGVNSGECCVGNMGSDQRFNYSVLGDAVNLASRLEGLGKTYGVDLCIGETTRALAADWPVAELDLVAVKGKEKPVRVYTLLPEAEPATAPPPAFAEHALVVEAYRKQRWQDALGLLGGGLSDALPQLRYFYEVYRRRIEEFIAAPPPADWDGVYLAKEK